RRAEAEARHLAEEAARLQAQEEARRQAEIQARLSAQEAERERQEADRRERAELEARIRAEVEAKLRAEDDERRRSDQEARDRAEQERMLTDETAEEESFPFASEGNGEEAAPNGSSAREIVPWFESGMDTPVGVEPSPKSIFTDSFAPETGNNESEFRAVSIPD